MAEGTPIRSHQHDDLKMNRTRTAVDMLKWTMESLGARTAGKSGILRVEERVFSREEHRNWLFDIKWSTLKTYI